MDFNSLTKLWKQQIKREKKYQKQSTLVLVCQC
jgi:hypothetical protein